MNRIKEMLQVAADYIREFCPEQLIAYDATECDGYCVAEDCELAKAELDFQLAQAHRDATEEVAKAHKRGWEQCHKEAVMISGILGNTYRYGVNVSGHEVANAIAGMEYKEKAND